MRVQVPFTAITSDKPAEKGSFKMVTRKYAFQDGLPKSDCPPGDATTKAREFFACHKNSPAIANDFATAFERNQYQGQCECRRRAHSVFSEVRDAQALLKSYPARFRYVSRGRINRTHGVCKHTPSSANRSHHSFWRFDDVAMRDIFTDQL